MAGPERSTNKNKTAIKAMRVRGESVRRRKYNHVPSARIGAVTHAVMTIGSMALNAA